MSHIRIDKLKPTIKFVRKFSKVPICIDTEGAQIRTKVKKKIKYKNNGRLTISKNEGNFKIYPPEVFGKMRKNDLLSIGFDALKVKIIKTNLKKINCKIITGGLLESNKGVHLINRNISLGYITKKDKLAIDIARRMNIKHYALSFTNTHKDVLKFNKLLKGKVKIFKIETRNAIKNLNKIMSIGKKFLIDRGDLSKAVSIEMLPVIQRKVLKAATIKKKEVYVAANFLESMIKNSYPTKGEANDIYNTLESGAAGIVLAAETAIGKYPEECIIFLRKIIKIFWKHK